MVSIVAESPRLGAAMATTTRRVATEQDLFATPKDGQKYELVDGEIRVRPAGDRHSVVAAQLVALGGFVKQHRLGYVCGADAGFRLPGANPPLSGLPAVTSARCLG
jgi:hypothetical protein